MNKVYRKIDSTKVDASKSNTINNVFAEIENNNHSFYKKSFKIKYKKTISLSFSVLIIFIIAIFSIDKTDVPVKKINITSESIDRISEISYISTSIISTVNIQIPDANNSLKLSSDNRTKFESNIDVFSEYFKMLKVFLDKDELSKEITEYSGVEFDYVIKYNLSEEKYVIYLLVEDESLSGEIHIGEKIYNLTGNLKETESFNEINFVISNESGVIEIYYLSDFDNAENKTYEIVSNLNGVIENKTIVLSKDDVKSKVTFNEGKDNYTLTRIYDDLITTYRLKYKIAGTIGDAVIEEKANNNGEIVYNYFIKENGKIIEFEIPILNSSTSDKSNQSVEIGLKEDKQIL